MTETRFRIDGALRRAVRSAVAASPSLTQEFRNAKRARRAALWRIIYHVLTFALAGPMIFVVIPIGAIWAIDDQWGADAVLAVLALISTAAALDGAQYFVFRLRSSKPVSVLSHLPAPDAEIARKVWREPAAWSFVLLYAALLAYGYLAWRNGFGPLEWTFAAVLAILHGLTCLATGTTLAAFFPRFPSVATTVLGAILSLCYFQAGAPRLADVTAALYLLLPAGWVNAVLGRALLQQAVDAWWGALAAAAWIGLAVFAMRRLTQRYRIRELVIAVGSEPCAELESPYDVRRGFLSALRALLLPGLAEMAVDEGYELDPTEAATRVRMGLFTESTPRPRSEWIERVIDRWLDDRERAVLELLTANRTLWSPFWWAISFVVAGLLILDALGALPQVGNVAALFAGAIYPPIVSALAGPWSGFRTRECLGSFVPMFAAFPVGFDEISRVTFKVAVVRSLSVLPMVVVVAACEIGLKNFNLAIAILAFAGYASTLLILHSWALWCNFSLGMRFPDVSLRRFGWHVGAVSLVVLAVYGGLAPLLVGLVQQVPGANALAAAGFVLIVGCTWGYGQLLRSMHRRGIVDLVRNRRALLEESLVRYDAGYVRARMAAELRRKHGWLWWLRERDARMDGA